MGRGVIGGRGLQSVALRQGAHAHRCAVGLTIVGEGAARGGYHDLISVLGDGQSTDALRNGVVAFLSGAVPGDAVGVLGTANLGLGASGRKGRGFTVHKTADAAFCGQSCAVIHLAGIGSRYGQGRGSNRHIAVGDVGNDNLIIIGHIIDVEAVGVQAHFGGSDIRPGNRCGNGFFQGDGDTGGERIAAAGEVGSIYRIGRSLVDILAVGTGDGHIYNRLRRKVGGVGIRDVDAIGILAGSEAGIGADHITLAVRPVDEVVVIIRRRGGAAGRAGGRCHSLGSQTYGTAFTSNIVNGHRGVFRVSNGNRRVRRGHRSGHHGLVSGVAGDHGGVYAVGGIIGDLLVYIRIRSSGAIFVNIVDGELKVGLFPVGNERQVAGGAGFDDNVLIVGLAAAGGAFAHGPAQELIAFPDRVNQGKAWRADIVIGGVGVGAAGPSGLIRAAVIQIIGNVELLQLQLEDNYVLGVVGGKDGFLGIDTVL